MTTGIKVDCYAGYRGDQRPVRFHLGEKVLEVVKLEDQWYSPDAVFFRVNADDGNTYVLRHDQESDLWILEAFRSGR